MLGERLIESDWLSQYAAASHNYMWTWFVGQRFVLMQDNNRKCTSKLCQRFIKSKEKEHVLEIKTGPVQSADINHIELVWDEIDRMDRPKHASSVAHTWRLYQESSAELSAVYIQSSVERMPRICGAVIETKEDHFNEWKIEELFRVFLFYFDLMWLRKTCN